MRLLPLLLCLAACAPVPTLRIHTELGTCGATQLTSSVFLTSAHCSSLNAEVSCNIDSRRAAVVDWRVHPNYSNTAWHDLAMGRTDRWVGCEREFDIAHIDKGDVIYHGNVLGQVDSVWGGTLVVDIAPRKFCFGDSGEAVTDGFGSFVGIISRWGTFDADGCSYHVRATSLEENRLWIESTLRELEHISLK